jgi:hypothetical protein
MILEPTHSELGKSTSSSKILIYSTNALAAFPTNLVSYAAARTTIAVKRKIQEITIDRFALGSKERLKRNVMSVSVGQRALGVPLLCKEIRRFTSCRKP